jgi:hypothetical protein
MATERDLEDVISRERALLDKDVRLSPGRLRELLHPSFIEFGASGTVWTLESVLRALPGDPEVEGEAVDSTATSLDEDAVLLTYRITGSRPSLRSSVWLRTADGWQMRFHQGTLLNP